MGKKWIIRNTYDFPCLIPLYFFWGLGTTANEGTRGSLIRMTPHIVYYSWAGIDTSIWRYLIRYELNFFLKRIIQGQSLSIQSLNQSELRLCVEVGDHGAPFSSVKCLHTALCHTHFRYLAHVDSPNSFFFVLYLFFHPPCPPTLIFVGNDAFLHVNNRSVSLSWYSKTSSVFFRSIIFNTSALLFISFQDILMILRYDHISKASILASICFDRVHVSQAYVNSDHT